MTRLRRIKPEVPFAEGPTPPRTRRASASCAGSKGASSSSSATAACAIECASVLVALLLAAVLVPDSAAGSFARGVISAASTRGRDSRPQSRSPKPRREGRSA